MMTEFSFFRGTITLTIVFWNVASHSHFYCLNESQKSLSIGVESHKLFTSVSVRLILWWSHTYTYTHLRICTHCHRSNGVVGSWQLRRCMAARRLRKWKSSISEWGPRRGGRPGKSPLGGDLIWEMMYSRKLIISLYKLCLPFAACTAISDPTNHPPFSPRTHTHTQTHTCLSVPVRSNHDISPFICIFFGSETEFGLYLSSFLCRDWKKICIQGT